MHHRGFIRLQVTPLDAEGDSTEGRGADLQEDESRGGATQSAVSDKTPVRFALAIILCVAVITRLASFHGYAGSDDGSYTELAYALSGGRFRVGEFVGPPVFPLRVGVFAPVALVFGLVGPGEWAMLAYPFLLSLAMVGIAFLAGRMFFGTRAGLIAAGVQALLPLAARSATMLMPDLPAAFWANVGVLLFCGAARRPQWQGKLLFGLLSGLALGISWLCKESVAYLAPLFLCASVYLVFRTRSNLALVAGLIAASSAVLLAESVVYWSCTGDLLHRLHETHRNYDYNKNWFFAEGSRYGWKPGEFQIALARRLLRDGPLTLFGSSSFGLVTAVAALAVLYAWGMRLRAFRFVSFWFVTLVLMFNFSSASVQAYRPLVLFDKYLYPVLFPAVLLTAGLLAHLLLGEGRQNASAVRERRFWGGLVGAGVLGACLLGLVENVWVGSKSRVERAVAARVRPTDVFYTDHRSLRVIGFFWGLPDQTAARAFGNLRAEELPSGAQVLINPKKLDFLRENYEYEPPAFCETPPDHWIRVRKYREATLYQIPDASAL